MANKQDLEEDEIKQLEIYTCRTYREVLQVSEIAMGTRLGLDNSGFCKFENNERNNIPDYCDRYADIFGITNLELYDLIDYNLHEVWELKNEYIKPVVQKELHKTYINFNCIWQDEAHWKERGIYPEAVAAWELERATLEAGVVNGFKVYYELEDQEVVVLKHQFGISRTDKIKHWASYRQQKLNLLQQALAQAKNIFKGA